MESHFKYGGRMKKYYFNPSCDLKKYKEEYISKITDLLGSYDIKLLINDLCCQKEYELENNIDHYALQQNETLITLCPECENSFAKKFQYNTISLWEVLDELPLRLPQLPHLTVSIQDPCPIRKKTNIHDVVRSLLHKMGVQIVETEYNREKSKCCGFLPLKNKSEAYALPFMKERAGSMPMQDVMVYCVSCIKPMLLGGKNPLYLLDLIFEEKTGIKKDFIE